MEKVLALDQAYPLPLLGVMLEKFPLTFEPAVWWPSKLAQNERKVYEDREVNLKKRERKDKRKAADAAADKKQNGSKKRSTAPL
ncbi:hypothetical protein CsSME_00035081 [Camellia sinensis var. sinensis]